VRMNTDKEKTSQPTAVMQIAGNQCTVCGENITLSSEGKFCADCKTVVHVTCVPSDHCSRCGQPYHFYERPKVDPLSDAVVPRALRPVKSGAPALAVFIMGLIMVVIIGIGISLTHLTGK